MGVGVAWDAALGTTLVKGLQECVLLQSAQQEPALPHVLQLPQVQTCIVNKNLPTPHKCNSSLETSGHEKWSKYTLQRGSIYEKTYQAGRHKIRLLLPVLSLTYCMLGKSICQPSLPFFLPCLSPLLPCLSLLCGDCKLFGKGVASLLNLWPNGVLLLIMKIGHYCNSTINNKLHG